MIKRNFKIGYPLVGALINLIKDTIKNQQSSNLLENELWSMGNNDLEAKSILCSFLCLTQLKNSYKFLRFVFP